MKWNRSLVGVVAAVISVMGAGDVLAQETTSGVDPAGADRQQELAAIAADRGRVVQEVAERWASRLGPANPALNLDGGFAQLTAALSSATPEVLLAASRAESYEEVAAIVAGREQDPTVIALRPGEPIPTVLGSATSDLVFTPITPCRIIDTRFATGGLAGRLIAGTGKQFKVNLADYTNQGGSAAGCGIPASLRPGAVALNLTSTDQTGVGNLRVIQTGGGVPTVSLLNFTPGVNLANAAVVSASTVSGAGDIFILSSNSDTHAVVDVMGYFAAPEVTALDVTTVTNSVSVAAGANTILSATCPAGRTATGGGCNFQSFSSPLYFISSNALGNGWNCAVQNRGGIADTLTVYVRCAHVPGR